MNDALAPVTATQRTVRDVAITAIELFVKTFAIGVPVLYVLGRAYKEAFWEHVSLSISLMAYSVEDYLYWGFAVVLNKLFAGLGWMPAGPIGAMLGLAAVLALISSLIVVLRRWVLPTLKDRILLAERRMREWRANDQSLLIQFLRPFVAMGVACYTLVFYFLLAILIAASPVLLAYKAGVHDAQQARKRLMGNGPVRELDIRALVHLRGEASPYQVGLLLECSSQWCVMLRRGDFVAVRQDDIARIDHCPATKLLANGALICAGKLGL